MPESEPSTFDLLAAALDEIIDTDGNLAQIASTQVFAHFAHSEAVNNALTSLNPDVYSGADIASLYNGVRSLPVSISKNWTASLSIATKPTTYIYSTPHTIITQNISPDIGSARTGSAAIIPQAEIYTIQGPKDDLSRSAQIQLTDARTTDFSDDEIIVLEGGNTAIRFNNRCADHIFLSIHHHQCAPYTLAFHPDDLSFAFASYAGENATSHFYLGKLGHALSACPDFLATLTAPERQMFASFLDRNTARSDTPIEIRWSYLQALARLAPQQIRPHLQELSSCPNQAIAALASKYLSAMKTQI
jgi:hypothetical protein